MNTPIIPDRDLHQAEMVCKIHSGIELDQVPEKFRRSQKVGGHPSRVGIPLN